MGAKWQRVRIDIPKNFTPRQREVIADKIIEHIVARTESGKDKDGKRFKAYSKSYKGSIDFKLKENQSGKPDLTLTGDMLAELQLLSSKAGSILIGYENGTDENAKADGNIRSLSTGGKKSRDFLGIQDNKLDRFIREVE